MTVATKKKKTVLHYYLQYKLAKTKSALERRKS